MPTVTEHLARAVDGLVRIVSPQRALLRQHLRRMEREPDYRETWLAALRAYGYKAARSGEGMTGWGNSAGSADREVIGDLPTLRSRAREVNRDDPIGRGLTKTLVLNTVGIGLRPRARTKNAVLNTAMETVWRRRKDRLYRAEGISHEAGQRLAWRKRIEDGDLLKRAVKSGPDEPVWIELIEADRLATPIALKLTNGNEIRDGVERDPNGVIVGYHVLNRHPGDGLGAMSFARAAYQFVPAELAYFSREVERPGQTRGVPWLCAVLQDLRDLDLLILASLKRMQIAACLAAFIKSDAPLDKIFDTTAKTYGYQLDQKIVPGMVFKLYPNESVETLTPSFPTPELEPFIKTLARRIGAAVGVSWQTVLRDFSQSTWSSARTDLLDARPTFYVGRQELAAELTWEWRMVMMDAQLIGEASLAAATAEEIEQVEWIGPRWEWVDPQNDAAATVTALKAGLTTFKNTWMSLGEDPDEMLPQLEQEAPLRKMFGLIETPAAVPIVAADDTDTEAAASTPAGRIKRNGKPAAVDPLLRVETFCR